MAKIEGILFDCDGVIANTEKIYMQSVCDTLNNTFNYSISLEEVFNSFKGSNLKQIEETLLEKELPFAEGFRDAAIQEYKKVPMGPEIAIPNIIKTLEALKGVSKAVCSNAQVSSIEKKLDIIGIKHHFEVLVGAGKYPKPHPEVYLKGSAGIRANIFNCLAVEDSVIGLKAAILSGAISVAYAANKEDYEQLAALRPEFIIKDMFELVELYNQLNGDDYE